MLFGFGKKRSIIQQPVLSGRRVYAIGDIHGRADLLVKLLDLIRSDCETGPCPAQLDLILLGDYIDRGRDSAAVLDLLSTLSLPQMTLTHLRGNHEQVLLDLLARPRAQTLEQWLSYGGLETLSSYGVGSKLLYSEDSDAVLQAVEQVIPSAHVDFLARTSLYHQIGDYFFAHAGVRPGRGLSAQSDDDMLWIRQPFLSSGEDFGAVVVHGHSISRIVESKPNRIGIDTGAYATGILTAVVLEEDQRRFIATSPAV